MRGAGDPDRAVRSVAVWGGSGGSFLGLAPAQGADGSVPADLRPHPADEHLRAGGPALVDVAHWASEYPWCAQARDVLDAAFADRDGWHARVSELRPDPWTTAAGAVR